MSRHGIVARRRTGVKKIENKDDRLTTFSKRRIGIYKKASELVTLCHAEIGILIFSESGKPYAYGAPNFETIVDRYLGCINQLAHYTIDNIMHVLKKKKLQELITHQDELSTRLEVLKKEGEKNQEVLKVIQSQLWWEAPLEDMSPFEIEQLTELMRTVNIKVNEKEKELELNNF